MNIKKAAEKLNTTARALRFYEEKGLISPEKNPENNYREYNENDLWRLQLILSLREVGLPTEEIRVCLADSGFHSIKDYLNLQRSALYRRLLQIKDTISVLDEMLDKNEDPGHAELYELSRKLKEMKQMRAEFIDKWHFDEQAEGYDENIKMAGYRFNVHQDYDKGLALAADAVQNPEGATGADIGTGTGNLAVLLEEKGAWVIGVDQSKAMLAVCAEKNPQLELRHGHFLVLPFEDHSLDFVVTSYALHHIPDEEKRLAIEEMSRVLKPGGQISILDLMFTDETDRERQLEKFRATGNEEAVYAINDEYYADCSLLIETLKAHGFKVESHAVNHILHHVYARK